MLHDEAFLTTSLLCSPPKLFPLHQPVILQDLPPADAYLHLQMCRLGPCPPASDRDALNRYHERIRKDLVTDASTCEVQSDSCHANTKRLQTEPRDLEGVKMQALICDLHPSLRAVKDRQRCVREAMLQIVRRTKDKYCAYDASITDTAFRRTETTGNDEASGSKKKNPREGDFT